MNFCSEKSLVISEQLTHEAMFMNSGYTHVINLQDLAKIKTQD